MSHHRSLPSLRLVMLVVGALSCPLFGDDPAPGHYRIDSGSTAQVGCLDLCRCAIREEPIFEGSFDLAFEAAGGTFTQYRVENANFRLGGRDSVVLRGDGILRVEITDDGLQQTIEIELSENGEKPRLFRDVSERSVDTPSKVVNASKLRPAELVCRGQILEMRANLAEPPFGGDPVPGRYRVNSESTAEVGCLDLCDCLIHEEPIFEGSFDLVFDAAGATFTNYRVENVDFTLGTDASLKLAGAGTLRIAISDDGLQQTIEMELSENGEEPRLFRDVSERSSGTPSAVVTASNLRPAELVCGGQIFHMRAELAKATRWIRSDCNVDGNVDISDAVSTLLQLFSGGDPSTCAAACDSNGDDLVNISDAIFTLQFLFNSGRPPSAPFPDCDAASANLPCFPSEAC